MSDKIQRDFRIQPTTRRRQKELKSISPRHQLFDPVDYFRPGLPIRKYLLVIGE